MNLGDARGCRLKRRRRNTLGITAADDAMMEKYRAEEEVVTAIKTTAAFKRAVNATIKANRAHKKTIKKIIAKTGPK